MTFPSMLLAVKESVCDGLVWWLVGSNDGHSTGSHKSSLAVFGIIYSTGIRISVVLFV